MYLSGPTNKTKERKMRKLTKTELESEADKIYGLWLGQYSLKNAVKISRLVRQRLWAERERRKLLKGK